MAKKKSLPVEAPEIKEAAVEVEKTPELDISEKLSAAADLMNKVGEDSKAKKEEQERTLKESEAEAKRRSAEAEKQRKDAERQAKAVAERKLAEFTYAENYRKKLLKDRERHISASKQKELQKKAEAEAKIREEREQMIAEMLESERQETEERQARADAALDRAVRVAMDMVEKANEAKEAAEAAAEAAKVDEPIIAVNEQPAEEIQEEELAEAPASAPAYEDTDDFVSDNDIVSNNMKLEFGTNLGKDGKLTVEKPDSADELTLRIPTIRVANDKPEEKKPASKSVAKSTSHSAPVQEVQPSANPFMDAANYPNPFAANGNPFFPNYQTPAPARTAAPKASVAPKAPKAPVAKTAAVQKPEEKAAPAPAEEPVVQEQEPAKSEQPGFFASAILSAPDFSKPETVETEVKKSKKVDRKVAKAEKKVAKAEKKVAKAEKKAAKAEKKAAEEVAKADKKANKEALKAADEAVQIEKEPEAIVNLEKDEASEKQAEKAAKLEKAAKSDKKMSKQAKKAAKAARLAAEAETELERYNAILAEEKEKRDKKKAEAAEKAEKKRAAKESKKNAKRSKKEKKSKKNAVAGDESDANAIAAPVEDQINEAPVTVVSDPAAILAAEQAAKKAEQAEIKAVQAEQKAEQAEIKASQAEEKAEQAEQRAAKAEEAVNDIASRSSDVVSNAVPTTSYDRITINNYDKAYDINTINYDIKNINLSSVTDHLSKSNKAIKKLEKSAKRADAKIRKSKGSAKIESVLEALEIQKQIVDALCEDLKCCALLGYDKSNKSLSKRIGQAIDKYNSLIDSYEALTEDTSLTRADKSVVDRILAGETYNPLPTISYIKTTTPIDEEEESELISEEVRVAKKITESEKSLTSKVAAATKRKSGAKYDNSVKLAALADCIVAQRDLVELFCSEFKNAVSRGDEKNIIKYRKKLGIAVGDYNSFADEYESIVGSSLVKAPDTLISDIESGKGYQPLPEISYSKEANKLRASKMSAKAKKAEKRAVKKAEATPDNLKQLPAYLGANDKKISKLQSMIAKNEKAMKKQSAAVEYNRMVLNGIMLKGNVVALTRDNLIASYRLGAERQTNLYKSRLTEAVEAYNSGVTAYYTVTCAKLIRISPTIAEDIASGRSYQAIPTLEWRERFIELRDKSQARGDESLVFVFPKVADIAEGQTTSTESYVYNVDFTTTPLITDRIVVSPVNTDKYFAKVNVASARGVSRYESAYKKAAHAVKRELHTAEKQIIQSAGFTRTKFTVKKLILIKELIDMSIQGLKYSVKFSDKLRTAKFKSNCISAMIDYNTCLEDYIKDTGEMLTPASAFVPYDIIEGRDYELMPILAYRKEFVEKNGDSVRVVDAIGKNGAIAAMDAHRQGSEAAKSAIAVTDSFRDGSNGNGVAIINTSPARESKRSRKNRETKSSSDTDESAGRTSYGDNALVNDNLSSDGADMPNGDSAPTGGLAYESGFAFAGNVEPDNDLLKTANEIVNSKKTAKKVKAAAKKSKEAAKKTEEVAKKSKAAAKKSEEAAQKTEDAYEKAMEAAQKREAAENAEKEAKQAKAEADEKVAKAKAEPGAKNTKEAKDALKKAEKAQKNAEKAKKEEDKAQKSKEKAQRAEKKAKKAEEKAKKAEGKAKKEEARAIRQADPNHTPKAEKAARKAEALVEKAQKAEQAELKTAEKEKDALQKKENAARAQKNAKEAKAEAAEKIAKAKADPTPKNAREARRSLEKADDARKVAERAKKAEVKAKKAEEKARKAEERAKESEAKEVSKTLSKSNPNAAKALKKAAAIAEKAERANQADIKASEKAMLKAGEKADKAQKAIIKSKEKSVEKKERIQANADAKAEKVVEKAAKKSQKIEKETDKKLKAKTKKALKKAAKRDKKNSEQALKADKAAKSDAKKAEKIAKEAREKALIADDKATDKNRKHAVDKVEQDARKAADKAAKSRLKADEKLAKAEDKEIARAVKQAIEDRRKADEKKAADLAKEKAKANKLAEKIQRDADANERKLDKKAKADNQKAEERRLQEQEKLERIHRERQEKIVRKAEKRRRNTEEAELREEQKLAKKRMQEAERELKKQLAEDDKLAEQERNTLRIGEASLQIPVEEAIEELIVPTRPILDDIRTNLIAYEFTNKAYAAAKQVEYYEDYTSQIAIQAENHAQMADYYAQVAENYQIEAQNSAEWAEYSAAMALNSQIGAENYAQMAEYSAAMAKYAADSAEHDALVAEYHEQRANISAIKADNSLLMANYYASKTANTVSKTAYVAQQAENYAIQTEMYANRVAEIANMAEDSQRLADVSMLRVLDMANRPHSLTVATATSAAISGTVKQILDRNGLKAYAAKNERLAAKHHRRYVSLNLKYPVLRGNDKVVCVLDAITECKARFDIYAELLRQAKRSMDDSAKACKEIKRLRGQFYRKLKDCIDDYNDLVKKYKEITTKVIPEIDVAVPDLILTGEKYDPVPDITYRREFKKPGDDNLVLLKPGLVVDNVVDSEIFSNRSAIVEKIRNHIDVDIEAISKRYVYSVAMKERLENVRNLYQFGIDTSKIEKERKSAKKQIAEIKKNHVEALRLEKSDNDRYYKVVLENPSAIKIKNERERDRLVLLREEIITLLDQRHELNAKLIAMYTGTDVDPHGEPVNMKYEKVRLAAAEAAYRRLEKFMEMKKWNIGDKYKQRVFDLMNREVQACADLAQLKMRINKEKHGWKHRRNLRKDIREKQRYIKLLQKTRENAFKRALEKHKDKEFWKRVPLVVSFIFVLIIAAGAYIFREPLLAFLRNLIG